MLLSCLQFQKVECKWSGPLIIDSIINKTMLRVREIKVKMPRVYASN